MPTVPSKTKAAKLVQRAKTGDTQAFGKLYDIYADHIYRYVLLKVKGHQEAQDLTAEVFRRTWIYLHKFKQQNFRAFLYKVAHNLCMDYFRKQKHVVRLDPEFLQTIQDQSQSIEEKLSQQVTHAHLHQALQQLTQNQRNVVMLRFVEELSVKETANILNKTGVTVRVTQYYALKKLHQLMTELDTHES